MDEIFERKNVYDGEKRVGTVSVRYPCFEIGRIDRFYAGLADRTVELARKRHCDGMLQCRVFYMDEEYASVMCDIRFYMGSECIQRHNHSFVWRLKSTQLAYITKRGKRCADLTYNGRELRIYN